MSLLAQVSRGVQAARPVRALIYGVPGAGKTTFASGAPAPLVLDAEEGSLGLDVARVQITSWADLQQAVRELRQERHPYRTVALDTLDALEALLRRHVVERAGVETIEAVGGGYGKGWTRVEEHWRSLLDALADLQRATRINVLACAHARAATHTDPAAGEHQRWELACHRRTSGPWIGWCDDVLFAHVRVQADRQRRARSQARALVCQPRPGVLAKTRRGLPPELPLSWGAYAGALRERAQAAAARAPAAQPEPQATEPSPAAEGEEELF